MIDNPPKMKDVAELAGVSIKTVSRVLNNEAHVKDAVRDKVRAAVAELNYVPSLSARSLRGNKSYNINLVCHSGRNTYINAIQFGAVLACQDLGYNLQISVPPLLTGLPYDEVLELLKRLNQPQAPDGVLLVAPFASDAVIDAALRQLGIPVARVGPISIQTDGVVVQIDDELAAEEATRHLIELGHRRIGFVRGIENQTATHQRYAGYSRALRKADLALDPSLVVGGMFSFDSGVIAANQLLSLSAPPTAVFAGNDEMAAGVIMAATKRGLSLPDDLSVVGFDDFEIASCMVPRLTTIRQPLDELGRMAITSLIEDMAASPSKQRGPVMLPHEFIVRESTAPPK